MAPDRPQVDTTNTVCQYCHYRWDSHSDHELLTLAGVSGDASECASRLRNTGTETEPVLCDDQGLGCQFAKTRNVTMRRSLTITRPEVTLVAILAVFGERPRYPQPLYYGN